MDVFEQPWRSLEDSSLPSGVLSSPGWLLPIERKLLWWIGARYWNGAGAIIDAGAFCGASAAAFAAGVSASSRLAIYESGAGARSGFTGSQRGPVVSYDKFVDADSFEREFIKEAFGATMTKGDAFLDYFLNAVAPYRDLVRVEVGDFLEKNWGGQPIEVLFLDICKTRALNAHAIAEFMPYLIPGHSLVIQQDFMGVWLPHINWCMEYLKDYFEVVDAECGPSRVYRLKEAIPGSVLQPIVTGEIPLPERLRLLDQLRDDSLAAGAPGTAMLVEGMKLQELVMERRLVEHDDLWLRFLRQYDIPAGATEQDFAGQHWIIEHVMNWIPRQILQMRATRVATR